MAYVGLADYYVVVPEYEPVRRTESGPKAIAAAQKALGIDDSLAEAHAALASASEDLWDWPTVEREYKRAIELNPGEVTARIWYGLYLSNVNRGEEAVPQLKRATELDPLNMTAITNLAAAYSQMRQYDKALEIFKQALEIDPNFANLHDNLGQMYEDMGKHDLTWQEHKKAALLADDQESVAVAEETLRAFAKGGKRAALIRTIEMYKQLARRRYVDSACIAYDYAELGDKDQTFSWLEKAYSEKSGALNSVKGMKAMDPFRSDPRYIDLLRRMGLPR